MKSQYIKRSIYTIAILIGITLISSLHAPRIEAGNRVPAIKGEVINAQTNAPIPGVWVKMTNSGFNDVEAPGSTCKNQPVKSRYEKTDGSGKFTFDGIAAEESVKNDSRLGKLIDTNLDGTNDAEQLPKLQGDQFGCKDSEGDPHYSYEFTCGSTPMTFTVVLPQGWSGTFDVKSNIYFNNGGSDFGIGQLYFHPSAPVITPAPTVAPTPAPTKAATPAPTATPYVTPKPTSTSSASSQTATIRVCKVILDGSGAITDGALVPGANFSVDFYDPGTQAEYNYTDIYPATGVPSRASFTTPLTLNTKISGLPDGPGAGGNNAQCIPYTVAISGTYGVASYFYKQETYPSGSVWLPPRYNDGNNATPSMDNFFEYDSKLVDGVSGNGWPRELNADANITLDPNEKRDLILLNQYNATAPTTTCDATSCTKKEIGDLDAISNSFISTATVDINKSYWVRLTVKGRSLSGVPVNIILSETINTAYFKIEEPQYGAYPTFKITRPKTGSEWKDPDLSTIMCPDTTPADSAPDCISNKKYSGTNLNAFDINLGSLTNDEVRYLYFNVTVTQPTLAGETIDVDSSSSAITYADTAPQTFQLANTKVSIRNTQPFFQVGSGDVYSAPQGTALNVALPPDTEFSQDSKSIISHVGSATYGQGQAGAPPWDLSNYKVKLVPSNYIELFNTYKENITIKNINGVKSFDTSGYYIDKNSINGNKQDFVISGNSWTTDPIVGKQIVLFVPGNQE